MILILRFDSYTVKKLNDSYFASREEKWSFKNIEIKYGNQEKRKVFNK